MNPFCGSELAGAAAGLAARIGPGVEKGSTGLDSKAEEGFDSRDCI